MLRGPFTFFMGLALVGAAQNIAQADQGLGNSWVTAPQSANYSGPQPANYQTMGNDSSVTQVSSLASDADGTSVQRTSLAMMADGSSYPGSAAAAAPSASLSGYSQNNSATQNGYGSPNAYGYQNNNSGGRLIPFIGVEATFFAPVNSGGASSSSSFTTGATTTTTNTANPNGLNVGPRLWLGVMGDRWGVLARYWRFTDDSNNFNPTATSSILSQSYLHLQTFDVEAIRRLYLGCNCNNSMWFTFGVRNAQFSQGSSVASSNLSGAGMVSTTGASSANFNGTGLTGSIWGLRQIGCSRVSLFYSGRASELWDSNASTAAQSSAQYSSVGGSSGATNFAAASAASGSLFIGELQVGLQYNHAMRCIPGTAFFRTGFEYQYWGLNNLGAARSTSTAAGGTLSGTSLAAANTGFLDLVGFNIGAGFMW